ncbi:MAG: hypothetical protein OXG36_08575 [Caldilineaceae bacterium]|nr:hypothetical protein [Caldilineaceae bacterium]
MASAEGPDGIVLLGLVELRATVAGLAEQPELDMRTVVRQGIGQQPTLLPGDDEARTGVVRGNAEGQFERFAPGFKVTVLACQVTLGSERADYKPQDAQTKGRNPGRLHSKHRQSVPCGYEALLTSVNLL